MKVPLTYNFSLHGAFTAAISAAEAEEQREHQNGTGQTAGVGGNAGVGGAARRDRPPNDRGDVTEPL